MSTTVVRTTTDKLEDTIAEQTGLDRHLTSSQFIGGRDWVLFFDQYLMATSEIASACLHDDRFDIGYYGTDSRVRMIERDGSVGVATDPNYGGWIEDKAQSWIIYFDRLDRPVIFWAKRDPDGGVMGSAVVLERPEPDWPTSNVG